MISNKLQIEYLPVSALKDYHRQLRKPSKKQIRKTIRIIENCGLPLPVAIDKDNCIIIGGHLVEAARQLDMDEIPVIRTDYLDEKQVRILRMSYDRIAEEAQWDKEALAMEFQELEIMIPDLDLTLTGFEVGEIDLILDFSPNPDPNDKTPEPETGQPAITKSGDLWTLGNHRLYCGDSLNECSYIALMSGQKAQMVFADPPYNVPIDGHVGGKGSIKHPEFAMASGEMSVEEFTLFLLTVFALLITHSKDGSIHYHCMDWRHMEEILTAARKAEYNLKNLCVWAKDNGGMGLLYRSQHELVFVFKNGEEPHINNIQLGKYGRYRTNVWEYAGVNTMRKGRMEELAMHPTVKPVAMVADAIRDCSKRNGLILDPFGGSGATLIAAEKT